MAGAGAAAGATSSTGAAGAKAASKSSFGGANATDAAAQANQLASGGDDGGDDGVYGGQMGNPGRGDSGGGKLIALVCACGFFFFLVVMIPMIFMGAAIGSCEANGSGGAAGDWSTAGKLVGASTFVGDMGYRGDMLNEHLAFAELGYAGATVGDVMGDLPHNTKIRITTRDGHWVIASKMDIGSGGGDVNGHPREIDIHVKAAEKLGLPHPEAWLGLVKYKIVKGAEAQGPQFGGPSDSGGSSSSSGGSSTAEDAGVPADLIPIYQDAAAKYHLGERGPSILAAINRIETNFGELATATSSAGAVGWMQFMPATWAAYGVDGNGDGRKDPTNKYDAIFAAANYLKASGAPGNWHDAIYAYNHAEWYVQDVLEHAEQYEIEGMAAGGGADCGGLATGPANMNKAVKVFQPKAFATLPERTWSPGFGPIEIDARVAPDAVWMSDNFDVQYTAGRETGHASHGSGLALDIVPKAGKSWDETTLKLAQATGWYNGCNDSCMHAVEPDKFPAWARWIGYNGTSCHGDPEHIFGGCGPHLHIGFAGSSSDCSELCEPMDWVYVFPAPAWPPDGSAANASNNDPSLDGPNTTTPGNSGGKKRNRRNN